MKKIIALVLSSIMCVGLLAGCSGSSTSTTAAATTAAAGGNETTAAATEATEATKAETPSYTFTVVNHDSATSMGELWLETILGKIAEESNGQIEFIYNPGGSLFGASETIDAVKEGSADICWATTGTYGGRFPLAEFINLPGNGINCGQMGSEVINRMYAASEEVQAEFADWKILALHGTSLAPISTASKKIEKVDDLKGLRLRTAGAIPTIYVNLLGATAVGMPTSEVYDNLAKNALDGMCNDWHNIDCFRLYEPIKYCLDVRINMTTSFILMNPDAYDSLTPELQAIFEKYCGSGYASDMAGYWWDSCRYWVGQEMLDNGVEIYEPSAELEAYMWSDEIVEQTAKEYISFLDGKGYDGQKFYDQFKAIVDEVAPKYANAWDKEFNYTDWTVDAEGYVASWNK